jgi:predicted acylesterase/phospholipase RssA
VLEAASLVCSQEVKVPEKILHFLKNAWEWLKDLAAVFKPCRFSAIMLGLVLLFFLFTEPGEDLLRSLAELERKALITHVIFFCAMIIWALNAWYWARVMLRFRFDEPEDDDPDREKRRLAMRKHVPRVLGVLAFLAVGLAFGKASIAYEGYNHTHITLYLLMATCITLAAMFYGFTAVRHKIVNKVRFKKRLQAALPVDPYISSLGSYRQLEKASLISLALSMILAVILFLLFLFLPEFAVVFGAAAIVLLAAATWIPFGSMLVYAGSSYKFPVITVVLALLFLFSFTNDNHTVRTMPGSTSNKITVKQDYKRWLSAKLENWPKGSKQPVFIVATEGGGIRAAYWTGIVLAALQDLNPEFADHIYAISGVSGGSLGAAVFTALVKEQHRGRIVGSPVSHSGPLQSYAHTILSADFLAPTAAYILYPDLFQRFLPFPVPWFDRSRAIEGAWENSWQKQSKSTCLSDGFHSLWDDGGGRLPALFLNSTWVESGKRVIASNLKIDDETFSDAVDIFDTIKAEMRLSSAVHNSARFTYVSPAGTIKTPKGVWGHLVDGGYFDNSGASTAVEILDVMEAATPELWGKITPVVIMITNDPRLNDAKTPAPYSFMNELMSPVRTFFNTRPARAGYSRAALYNWACQKNGIYLPIGLQDADGPLPMSWVLSDVAKKTMQKHLDQLLNKSTGKLIDPVNVIDLEMLEDKLI